MTPIFKFETSLAIILIAANNIEAAIELTKERKFIEDYGYINYESGSYNTALFSNITCVENAAVEVESWYFTN